MGAAMRRRLISTAAGPLLALALLGCANTGRGGENIPTAPVQPIIDPTPRPGAPVVLIAMPASSEFADVRRTLVAEIRKNFNVTTFVVGPSTSSKEFGDMIAKAAPACVVVMNNSTVKL